MPINELYSYMYDNVDCDILAFPGIKLLLWIKIPFVEKPQHLNLNTISCLSFIGMKYSVL